MNFLSTGNQFTELALDNHKTTLIVGENGAGKSTFLDALSFGLYNKSFRKINKPQLINSVTNKGLLVEVEFEIGAKQYLVRRGMRPNIFEIYQDGRLVSQSAANRDYQDYLEKSVLKINHKSFSQIVILGSANFIPFMKLPAWMRREVIEDLLDIQIFSVMNTLLKDKIAANKTELHAVESTILLLEGKLELHERHLNTMKQNHEELIFQRRQKITSYKTEIAQAQALIEDLERKLDARNEQVTDHSLVTKRTQTLRDLKKQIEHKSKKFQKEIDFYGSTDQCPTCRQPIDGHFRERELAGKQAGKTKLEAGLAQLHTQIASAEDRLEEIEQLLKEVGEISRAISENHVKIASNSRYIQGIEEEINELKVKITELKDDQETSKELKSQLASSQAHKEVLLEDRDVMSVLGALLKDGGIKTKIIRQYVPVMNKLINKYLAALDFFISFELDENFEEKIKSRFRDEFSYESFSEGEKMRIDVALLFAWRAIAKLRNSASTNLLVMDEIFDGSLDGDGIDEFLKILTNLTQDTNVFIISHKQDQMIDKFEHTIRFIKTKNFSQMAA